MTVSRKSFILGTAALSSTALLAACGRSSDSSSASGKTISIKHVYGTTEVPEGATKIATLAWANQDVLLALGIMPVGFSKQDWGVTDGSGMLPWTKEKVEEMVSKGAAQPKLFDETGGTPFEEISATKPEVILAAYSGITKEDYDKLSKIAPTVAYPKITWGTPWRETITIDATAVGKKTEGEKLVADLEKQVADAVAKHPQIKGKAAAFCYTAEGDATKFGFYTTADPRTAFLSDLGMKVPASQGELLGLQRGRLHRERGLAQRLRPHRHVRHRVRPGHPAGQQPPEPGARHQERRSRLRGQQRPAGRLHQPRPAVDPVGHRELREAHRRGGRQGPVSTSISTPACAPPQ